jgi:polysaccharide deacetylase 2 family uncharacterized protein YibQ
MEQNKQRGRKKTLRTAIFSARKKPGRRLVRRYALAAVVLLIVLTLAVVLLIRVLQPDNEGVASAPPPPLIGSPLTPDETRARIAALNEKITEALSDIGLSPDSVSELTEAGESRPDIEYVRIQEHYAVPSGMRPERVRGYLQDYVEGYRGVLSEETAETAQGGFEMTVFAYGLPIRGLSFSTTAGSPPPPPPPSAKLPKVAIIIDDMGANRAALNDLLSLKYPVTIAVIPFLELSTETADAAYKKGREVILHLPMEPMDYPQYNPGTGALFTFMTADEFRAALAEDLAAVPHISGVNNHMGSSLTQDREKMEIVLAAIKERRLFFVDSRTTPKTVAYDAAVKLGVPALERDVFLDNEANVESVKAQIDELIRKAKAEGTALGIGHPRPATIKALKEMEKRLTGSEVQVVPASGLLKK